MKSFGVRSEAHTRGYGHTELGTYSSESPVFLLESIQKTPACWEEHIVIIILNRVFNKQNLNKFFGDVHSGV